MKPFVLGTIVLVLAAACQNDGRWYPEADVSIETYSEYASAAGKQLAVTVIVRNTGITSITSATVTIKAVTNKRTYLQTMGSTAKIIPGGAVAVTVRIDYLEAEETLTDGGISLYDSFFA
ncbi:MAG: hypothetical protein LBU16_02780 [Treponema sp.]|jgi:hypothetical protein|nr:hypothetical protein [Treponema sp.]